MANVPNMVTGQRDGFRTRYFDPDYRRDPRTSHFCVVCQKDLKPGQPFRAIHVVGGGMDALHPGDEDAYVARGKTLPGGQHADDVGFHPIGSDCARRLGLEWTWPPGTIEP